MHPRAKEHLEGSYLELDEDEMRLASLGNFLYVWFFFFAAVAWCVLWIL